jgi:hypothetical protein
MHLLWMSALLAASPCDDALAYDGRGKEPPADSARYGVPLTFARLLLACIYFFPGFHKLATSGIGWAMSDNLRNQMWWKWAEHGVASPLRVDRVPWLLHAGAWFVLAFELSFPALVLVRRTRPWAAAMGLVFHALSAVFLFIPFVGLWTLYVVLVDPRRAWLKLRSRFMRTPGRDPTPATAWEPSLARASTWIAGTLLVLGAVIQGARGQMRSFPFACYPTFEWIVGTEMPDLVVTLEGADGRETVVPFARDARGYRTQREWGEIWSLVGVTSPFDAARLRAYADATLAKEPGRSLARGAVLVHCYRAFVPVDPDRKGEFARRGQELARLALPLVAAMP